MEPKTLKERMENGMVMIYELAPRVGITMNTITDVQTQPDGTLKVIQVGGNELVVPESKAKHFMQTYCRLFGLEIPEQYRGMHAMFFRELKNGVGCLSTAP